MARLICSLLLSFLMASCVQAEDAGGGAFVLNNETDTPATVVFIGQDGQERAVRVVPARQKIATYQFAGPSCADGALVARTRDGSEIARISGPFCAGEGWTITPTAPSS